MSFDVESLFRLLPAIHRVRDVELARGNPHFLTVSERAELATLESISGLSLDKQHRLNELREKRDHGALKSLLEVLAEPIAAVQENLDQLYDDQFIETCAEWVVPYIGDLIGCRTIHPAGPDKLSSRAEVAHTMAYRRRKGTAAILEQFARDVTGSNARVVEFFQLLATTQYMNHLRPKNVYAPDLRKWEILERLGTAFDKVPHTVDIRRISSGRGRYNIPNIGIFLWRLNAYSLTLSPAVPVQLKTHVDKRRYRLSPLGNDMQIFTQPESENEITHLAEPINVPLRLSRRVLYEDLKPIATDPAYSPLYYGSDRSLQLFIDNSEIPAENIIVCDLSDSGDTWANLPPNGKYAIDPVLGRVALPSNLNFHTNVKARFHYGFSADLGGGEYSRAETFNVLSKDARIIQVPTSEYPLLQSALDALNGSGTIVINDSGRYEETLSIKVADDQTIEIRAADKKRPTIVLKEELRVTGGDKSALVINGVLFTGHPLRIPSDKSNKLKHLKIAHSTWVPGLNLKPNGKADKPGAPSIIVEIDDVEVKIEKSITGAIRTPRGAMLSVEDSIIDAGSASGVAYSSPDGADRALSITAGGKLKLNCCTVIGKLYAYQLQEVTNSIILAECLPTDIPKWRAPVIAERRQVGCVRFSYLPANSRVPRRYRCRPDPKDRSDFGISIPHFVSLQYGQAEYGQLSPSTLDTIRRGADDEGEMGALHYLLQPQREANLRIRLAEYLRVGLEAGIFYET